MHGSVVSAGAILTILLSALTLLTGSMGANAAPDREIFVRTDKTISVERLASAVHPFGKIESREPGTSVYLIQLNLGFEAEKAKQRLEAIKGVKPLDADEEPFDMNSVKSLTRKISHLNADEAEERKSGHKEKAVHEKEKADYLKAYRYFVGQRAFPNDKVDWSAYARARAHVTLMRPTVMNPSRGGIHPLESGSWAFVGPTNLQVPYDQYYGISPVNGRVNAVAYDPNNTLTIYAGGAQGGLWKSTDAGVTWNWLSSSWTQLAVNCIAIDPTSGDIYVGRGDYHGYIAGSYGIMKSTDGGATWTEIAEATMGQVGVDRILLDPTNPNTIIAGTGDTNTYGHLYRSTDGGQNWTKLTVGGTDTEWPALAASAPNGNTVRFYAVAAGYAKTTGSSSRVFKSDDHGATWQAITSPVTNSDSQFHYAYAIATSPTNASNVYVLDSENQLLFTSANQGASWTNVSAYLPTGNQITTNYNFSQSFYDYHLECGSRVSGATSTDLLFLGEIDITESADGGKTWTSIGGPTFAFSGAISHNDQHCLAVNPTNPNQAIFSNDGGVYGLSYNAANGNTVTPLSQNLGVSMFYKIALHPTNPDYILGGTQDNASPLSTGDLSNWLNVGGGDGGGSAINQVNPSIQYTTSEDLTVYRTPNGWTTENDISPSPQSNEYLPFVGTVVLDPSNQALMYIGTNYLYQWNDTQQRWKSRLGNQDLTNDSSIQPTLEAIAVAPTDSNRIYTGSADGALWMTTDQGATWTHLNAVAKSLPNQAITSINVSPANANDILIGLSGTGQSTTHLYRCTNTLAKTVVFTSVSGSGATGIPDISLNAIARDLDNPASTWWIAMDSGVFQTQDSGKTWTAAGAPNGLPNVIVDDLVAVPATRYLNAGTYGRGFWRLRLPVSSLVSVLTNCTVSPSAVGTGSTATGTVTLSSPAPAGGVTVNLTSSATGIATVPASVTVPQDATSATFAVNPVTTGASVISASSGGVTFTQDITVAIPGLSTLTVSPTSVAGGSSANGTVSINAVASGPTTISLTSSNAKAQVPATVVIPAGSLTGTFTITTSTVTLAATATITAKYGTTTKTATLAVKPVSVQSIALSPTLVVGGSQNSVFATVTLSGPAGATGAKVVLLSSNVKAATVPASVTVPAGQTTASFVVTHLAVTATLTSAIKATFGGLSQSATLTVNPIQVTGLTISPSSVVGGVSTLGTLNLNVVVGSKPIVIKLTSSARAAVVPLTVSVAAGMSSASFTIKTTAVAVNTNATITAADGASNAKAVLLVKAPTLASVTASPSSVQGSSTTKVTGTVTLSSAAPLAGITVTLKSSNTASATVPVSVRVLSGKLTGTFVIAHKKVTSQSTVTITASQGGLSQTTTVTVTP